MPRGFEIIPEAEEIGAPFRHVVFGSYRIIYHVAADQVAVYRVIHAARMLAPQMLKHRPTMDE
jgi:plasmid stabilization system protein ParE